MAVFRPVGPQVIDLTTDNAPVNNAPVNQVIDLTASDDEDAPAPSGAAAAPKQRKPPRPHDQMVEHYSDKLERANVRLLNATTKGKKRSIKAAEKQIKKFTAELKAAERRHRNASAKQRKDGKQPAARSQPKPKPKATVVVKQADDAGVGSCDKVISEAAAADVAEAGSPRPDMPESQPMAGCEWVFVTRPDDWWRQNDYMCWCGKRYSGAEPLHEDHDHSGVWVEKPIGWKEGDADHDSEDDEQQQDDNESNPDNISDEAYAEWQKKCKCKGDIVMHQCDCGALPNLAFQNNKWHSDVKQLCNTLKKQGKFDVTKLDEAALKVLKTLPCHVALLCLGKVRDEKDPIRNMNIFIVKYAQHLRNQWCLEDIASSSSSGEDEDEDEESDSDDEEGDRHAAKRQRVGQGGMAGGRA